MHDRRCRRNRMSFGVAARGRFKALPGARARFLARHTSRPSSGIATTPVINRPEVAIIGPNKIVERPVYTDGDRLERRKLMNISISCDHRVVDGWDAANFVQALKRRLEAPLLMLAG